jgi:hypothetical protein
MRDSTLTPNFSPAILGPDEVARWIGEDGASDKELKALLRPYSGMLVMRPQEPNKPRAERNTTRAGPKPPPPPITSRAREA